MTTAERRDLSVATEVDTFNVAVVQMSSRIGAWQKNIDDASQQVRSVAAGGAKIIVLPELFATGYDLGIDMHAVAESIPGRTSTALSALAAETDTVLVTAIVEQEPDGTLSDSSLVVGPDGLIASGRKRFLWDKENSVFTPGPESGLVVETPFGRVGVVICYEAGFPETVRDLVQRGADVIAVPSAFGHVRLHVWKLLTRSRALENGAIVAAAGLTGQTGSGPRFAGHSVIVDPQGRTIVEMDEDEGAVSAAVERRALLDARDEVPYLKDLARLGGITEKRATGVPAAGTSATGAPATGTPATENTVTDIRVTEAPATGAPVTGTPATENTVTDIRVTEAPATGTPANENTVTDIRVTEAPATGTLATEAPVVENPRPENTATETTQTVTTRERNRDVRPAIR